MPNSPRTPLVVTVALAAGLSLLASASACNQDEPATYVPEAGEWSFEQTSVVNNTCSEDLAPEPMTIFLLDYDGGDSFQIELGDDDVVCEIDGTAFSCSDYVVTEMSPDADITLTFARTWEGEFLSTTEAEGNDITTLTCAGEDCNFLGEAVPCTVNVTFEAIAL